MEISFYVESMISIVVMNKNQLACVL